ncbi:MAG: ornithine carbamoyltransferase [Burkholderiales bacterium]|nr:ornithine carbamoyltransferase [Phycisphaerae bacterium]
MTHFISIAEHPVEWLQKTLDVSAQLKKQLKETGCNEPILACKTAALIFEKPSLRTRVSFAQAMQQCGGNAITLTGEEVGLGKREPAKDVARVLSGMCDLIVARVFEHEKLLDLRQHATVPVINALSDYSHPCQAMSDMLTLRERFGKLEGLTLAYIGDGNNVARSLAVACGKFGLKFVCATPAGYALPQEDMDRIMSQVPAMDFETTNDPVEAVRNADAIYTDTWTSMGQEEEKQKRLKDFSGFQINLDLLVKAPKHAVVLHCLPAYRGLEITDEVMECEHSLIFPQAENRLHYQKGLIAVLMGKA